MSTFMTGDTSGGLKKSSGVSLNEPSITAAWNATREQAAGYVITSYVNGSKTNIDVQESSPIGSWEQLKTALGKFNATACYGGVAAAGKFHHVSAIQRGGGRRGGEQRAGCAKRTRSLEEVPCSHMCVANPSRCSFSTSDRTALAWLVVGLVCTRTRF